MKDKISSSETQTKKIAAKIAKQFNKGIIALTGNLGAGKTVFVQGFAKGLGIKEKIISPTFVLIRQHQIPQNKRILYHIDLYRLSSEKQFLNLGLKEILSDENNLVLIEWAEKIKKYLPKKTLWVNLENVGEKKRSITIQNNN